ncbi:MAG: MMPL family transporter [Planctomycetota bacterium]|nr:MMPL family transporter [Planctomycetota bacterium]
MAIYRMLIVRGWWVILLLLLAGVLWLGRHVPDIEVHAGTSVLLDVDDPDLAYYESTRPLWGYDEYAIVYLTRTSWIDPEGLALLRRYVAQLEAAPHVAGVTSVLDVPLLRQQPGPVIDPTAIPTLASEGLDHDRARGEILAHTQARNSLITADGHSVALLVYVEIPEAMRALAPRQSALRARLQTDPDARAELRRLQPELDAAGAVLDEHRLAMVQAIRRLSASWAPDLTGPVRLSGTSIIHIALLEHLRHDLRVFGVASFLLFTLAFVVIYRKPRFVILPIVTSLLPVVLVLGAMSLLGMKLTIITANLPVLLFTLMLPYTVYFVERYRERRSLHPEESGASSSVHAARAVWLPCLFSCATTMAAFAALMTSGTVPVHDFGMMMAIGMGVGLVIVFLAIPSLSRPLHPLPVPQAGVQAGPRKIVRVFASLSVRHPRLVVLVAGVTLAVSLWGASRLSAQSKFTQYFKPGTQVFEGLETIDREMGGTTPLELMITSPQPGFFLTPDGLKALRAAQGYFDDVPETGTVRSLATLVDELHKKNPHAATLLPMLGRHPMVRGVTREFANDDYSVSRVLIRMRETAPTLDRARILRGLRAHLAACPELAGLEVRETGVFLLYANMLESLMRTQRETFLYVIAAIFLMLLVLFRSPTLAFLVVLTQALPAVVILGLMGWFGITLDLVTVMITSIAMGVGIDASIQYTFRYRAELAQGYDRGQALRRSHATIGRAIWIATTVIIVGFCVLILSDFRPSIFLGLLTAVAMLMSQLAALTVLPSILLLTRRPRMPRPTGAA